MAATRQDIDGWIKQAIKDKMKFIISVCDTWDYEDYPVYCKDEKELKTEYAHYDGGENMQMVNEIIKIENDKVTEGLSIYNIN